MQDEMLARFVVSSHIRSHPDGEDTYAREHEEDGPEHLLGTEDEEGDTAPLPDSELLTATVEETETETETERNGFDYNVTNGRSGGNKKYIGAFMLGIIQLNYSLF